MKAKAAKNHRTPKSRRLFALESMMVLIRLPLLGAGRGNPVVAYASHLLNSCAPEDLRTTPITWDDLDGPNRTLCVARSVENSGRVKTIKTDRSPKVDLSVRLTSALLAFQASPEADAMVDGKDTIEP